MSKGEKWEKLIVIIRMHFSKISLHNTLYRTNVCDNIDDIFIDNIDDMSNYFNCRACRKFLKEYARLVYFDNYTIKSAIFPDDIDNIPDIFRNAVIMIKGIIESSVILDVFKSNDIILGSKMGKFSHLSVEFDPNSISYLIPFISASEVVSLYDEYFESLKESLIKFDSNTIRAARYILDNNYLPASPDISIINLIRGEFEWFEKLHGIYTTDKDDNIIWKIVGEYGQRTYMNHSLLGVFLEYAEAFFNNNEIK